MSHTYVFFSFRNISLTMEATYIILLKSQNHRVILSEGTSRGILSNALRKAGLISIRILRVTSSWVLSISKVGDSTASLGNLFQQFSMLTFFFSYVKSEFPVFHPVSVASRQIISYLPEESGSIFSSPLH